MPTDNEQLREIINEIQARHAGTDAGEVTALAIGIWRQLAFKFVPLLGPNSVNSIYARSLESNKSAFPWLPDSVRQDVADLPLMALKASLLVRRADEVILANSALLDTFVNLLATLIGARLTIPFLRSAFPHEAHQKNTQEKKE